MWAGTGRDLVVFAVDRADRPQVFLVALDAVLRIVGGHQKQ